MRYFDYSMLDTLAAVGAERSFEGAAQALGVTQSAVSQKIKLLETRLGAILVIRGRPCKLTPLGTRLCNHLKQVDILEFDLKEALSLGERDDANGHSRRFRVAINHDSLISWFPEVISRASKELDIRFEIIPNDQDHTANHLKNGEAIAAVSSESRVMHGFRRMALGNLSYTAVASSEFLETWLSSDCTVKKLSRAPCLVYNQMDMRLRHWCLEAFGDQPVLDAHAIPSFPCYRRACLDGVGWGLFPRTAILDELGAGQLAEIRPGVESKTKIYWHCSYMESETLAVLSKIVRAVARTNMR